MILLVLYIAICTPVVLLLGIIMGVVKGLLSVLLLLVIGIVKLFGCIAKKFDAFCDNGDHGQELLRRLRDLRKDDALKMSMPRRAWVLYFVGWDVYDHIYKQQTCHESQGFFTDFCQPSPPEIFETDFLWSDLVTVKKFLQDKLGKNDDLSEPPHMNDDLSAPPQGEVYIRGLSCETCGIREVMVEFLLRFLFTFLFLLLIVEKSMCATGIITTLVLSLWKLP